jgi:hypothetical protein
MAAEAYGGIGAADDLIELLRTVGLRLSIEVEAKGASDLERSIRGSPERRPAAYVTTSSIVFDRGQHQPRHRPERRPDVVEECHD